MVRQRVPCEALQSRKALAVEADHRLGEGPGAARVVVVVEGAEELQLAVKDRAATEDVGAARGRSTAGFEKGAVDRHDTRRASSVGSVHGRAPRRFLPDVAGFGLGAPGALAPVPGAVRGKRPRRRGVRAHGAASGLGRKTCSSAATLGLVASLGDGWCRFKGAGTPDALTASAPARSERLAGWSTPSPPETAVPARAHARALVLWPQKPPRPAACACTGAPCAPMWPGESWMAAAVKLFELGRRSAGAAAELAAVPKLLFLVHLADYGVAAFRHS
jgi:hypothetical protein